MNFSGRHIEQVISLARSYAEDHVKRVSDSYNVIGASDSMLKNYIDNINNFYGSMALLVLSNVKSAEQYTTFFETQSRNLSKVQIDESGRGEIDINHEGLYVYAAYIAVTNMFLKAVKEVMRNAE